MASPNAEIEENDSNIKNIYSVIDDSKCATYEKLNKNIADDATEGNIYLRINSQSICSDIKRRKKSERKNSEEIVGTERQVWSVKRCLLICFAVIALAGSIALVAVLVTDSSSNSEQIDPNAPFWTAWGAWTTCTVTCGNGIHRRYRTCNSTMMPSGRCLGKYVDHETCSMPVCPVYGSWATWESWTSCDVTCSGGSQSRHRTCNKMNPSDLNCDGDDSQSKACADWECPECTRTCAVGKLNADCDTCICEGSILTGRVTATGSGNAVSAAAIFWSSAPTRLIGQSDRNGYFTLNDTCPMTQLIVSRSGFIDAIVNVTNTYIQVIMDRQVKPYFIEIPQSKVRLTGDDVILCCQAEGAPDISYYEWFKDSRLYSMAWYPNSTQLVMSGLKTEDSGQYTCRANSPVGSIMSPPATILVKERSKDFCADALRPKSVILPSDCIQQDTNSTLYDVGECTAKKCSTIGSKETQTCHDVTRHCCIMSETDIKTVQCSEFELLVIVVTACGCGVCSSPSLTVEGIAQGVTSDDPLKIGEVWANGKLATYTTSAGRFSFSVKNHVDRLVITLKDRYFNRFLDAVKVVHVPEETHGTIFLDVKMMLLNEPVNLASNIQNTVASGPMLKAIIPSDAFANLDGRDFNGTVKARLTFLDTLNASQLEDVPGEFQFVDEEGQTGNLNTLGVFDINFKDDSGNVLSVNEAIDVHIPPVIGTNVSTQNFTLWRLNLDTGIWENIGIRSDSKRKKRTVGWIGSIDPSLSANWYNVDKINYDENICFFKLRIYKDTNFEEEIKPRNTLKINIIKILNGTVDAMSGNTMSAYSDRCMKTVCDGNEGFITVSYYENGDQELLYAGNKTFEVDSGGKGLKVVFRLTDDSPFFRNETTCIDFETSKPHVQFRYSQADESFTSLEFFAESEPPLPVADVPHSRLAWYPKRGEGYRACFIKIRVNFTEGSFNLNNSDSIVVRVKSIGGIQPNITGKVLGIRDFRLTNPRKNTTVCIEYKCSGSIPPKLDPAYDFTNITVIILKPETYVKCTVASESQDLVFYTDTVASVSNNSQKNGTAFQVFAAISYGTQYGLYSYAHSNDQTASEAAKQTCKSGHDSLTSPNDYLGIAATFLCSNY